MALNRLRQLMQAAARRRAADPGVSQHRRHADPADVEVLTHDEPWASYFAIAAYGLRYRRFDGAWSPPIRRAVFVSGDSATVLPWDPRRDRVLVIEQFRAGPFARGDANPWLLEAIAGRIDPGETPAECARREAVEEAGLALDRLIEIGSYYPTPGAVTEKMYSFLAICDLPDDAGGRLAGLAAEAEDIRTHLLSRAELATAVTRPEGANAPLLISSLWLNTHHDRLRDPAGRLSS